MKEKIVLLGCGGHAKSVVDAIETANVYEIVGFVDNISQTEFEYRGYKVIGCDNDLQKIFDTGIRNAFICVGFLGRGRTRNKLYSTLKRIGYKIPPVIDSSAILATDVEIENGAFVGKHAIINSNAKIGKMTIINTAAMVEHDSVIGEFTHLSVASVICGAVTIGNNSFVGANATIVHGVHVGESVIIGAGTVLVNDVEDACTVLGVPGKIIKYHE